MPKKSKYPKLRVYVKRGKAGQVWQSFWYDKFSHCRLLPDWARSRLVVEAAQRQHEYHAEDAARTPEQAREHERKRREAWDMLNWPLGA